MTEQCRCTGTPFHVPEEQHGMGVWHAFPVTWFCTEDCMGKWVRDDQRCRRDVRVWDGEKFVPSDSNLRAEPTSRSA